MADTELKGTIKLTADLSDAKRKVQEGVTTTAPDAPKSPSKLAAPKQVPIAKDEAVTFVQGFSRSLNNTVRANAVGLLGPVGRALSAGVDARAVGMKRAAKAVETPYAGPPVIGSIGTPAAETATAAAGAAGSVGAGAAAAGGGLAAAAPPLLIGAGIVVAGAAFIKTLKGATTGLIDFVRSNASWSGRMTAVLTIFDIKMRLIGKQIGDALAPNIKELTDAIVDLAKTALPMVIGVLKVFANTLSGIINLFDMQGRAMMNFYEYIGNIPPEIMKLLEYIKGITPKPVKDIIKATGSDSAIKNSISTVTNSLVGVGLVGYNLGIPGIKEQMRLDFTPIFSPLAKPGYGGEKRFPGMDDVGLGDKNSSSLMNTLIGPIRELTDQMKKNTAEVKKSNDEKQDDKTKESNQLAKDIFSGFIGVIRGGHPDHSAAGDHALKAQQDMRSPVEFIDFSAPMATN